MTDVVGKASTDNRQRQASTKGGRFRATLLASTIIPNLKVVSATNAFQPLALPLIVGYSVLTGRVSPIAIRFLYFFMLTTVVVTWIHGDLSATTILYAALYLSGPLTLIYLLGIRSDEQRPLAIVVQAGLILCFASVAEQFLIGSRAVESVWSLLFANHQEPTEFGLRGANGFTSEPSHVGRLFVTLLFVACILKIRGWRTWLVLAIPFIVMNRSASAFLLLVALIAALLYSRSKILFALAVAAAAATFPYFAGLNYRFVEEIRRLWTALTSGGGTQSIVELLGTAGGRRAIQTAIGYVSLIYYPLGHGVASYLVDFRGVAATMGFALSDFSTYDTLDSLGALKPSSYFSQIAYDYGLLGIAPLAALVIGIKREYRLDRSPLALMCLAVGVLQLVVATTTTEPWPWVMIAAGLARRSEPKTETPRNTGDHG